MHVFYMRIATNLAITEEPDHFCPRFSIRDTVVRRLQNKDDEGVKGLEWLPWHEKS